MSVVTADDSRPDRDDIGSQRGYLEGWKAINEDLIKVLLSKGMSQEDAADCASGMSDLWQRAAILRASVEAMARASDEDPRVAAILNELDDLDWEYLWLRERAQRIWRHCSGSAWESRKEEIEGAEGSIASWWRPKDLTDEAARAIVELRRLARRMVVSLHTYDLLAIGRSQSVGRSRAALRRLVERTRLAAERLARLFG